LSIRQPIVSVLGHVDHGKTTLLDKIRGTAIAKKEAGGITQHIGATEIPLDVIKEICGPILDKLGGKLTIPGLLFIDTPGHEAFTNLRKRGGSIADLAVLVIDVNEGFRPQTIESLNILRSYKVPFVVAANKIDRIRGWNSREMRPISESIRKQKEWVVQELDKKIYELVGSLSRMGFSAERFDRIRDFTREVCIVPVSALTGEGIPELLAIISGLAQKYLEKNLKIEAKGPGKGTVLEVKEEPGLGITIDVILYDGMIRRGDEIVVGSLEEPILTKVRALLKPKPLDEIRDPREKFSSVEEVTAAAGVKIAAPSLEKAVAGSPVLVAKDNKEELIKKVKSEISEIIIEKKGKVGLVVKADTLGSLEAILSELRNRGIEVKIADVGEVSKRDVMEAYAVSKENSLLGAILAFNVKVLPEAKEEAERLEIDIIKDEVIYRLIEKYEEFVKSKKEEERRRLEERVLPGKIRILPGFVFRRSDPAIFGVEVISGRIRPNYPLINEKGRKIGRIKEIQDKGERLKEARSGSRVAISVSGPTVGRQIKEGEVLYTLVSKEVLDRLDDLDEEDRELALEISRLIAISSGGDVKWKLS